MSLITLALTACAPVDTAAPEVHAFVSDASGFDTTTYWVDTGSQVVVFDTQFTPELAEAMLAEIQAATDSPVTHVVVTHANPDKFNGATVFQEAGAELVASEATASAMPGVHAYKEAYFTTVGMFEEGAYPTLPVVDRTFSGTVELVDGITLHELDHGGVTTSQTVALAGDALFVGDLVAGRAHAWLEGGIVDGAPTPDLDSWVAALDELRAFEGATVYPGRGEALPVNAAVQEQQDYLVALEAIVAGHLGELDDPMAALSGDEAWDHYGVITADAEAAFPEHSLSYLVTYGVYGLALQLAAE